MKYKDLKKPEIIKSGNVNLDTTVGSLPSMDIIPKNKNTEIPLEEYVKSYSNPEIWNKFLKFCKKNKGDYDYCFHAGSGIGISVVAKWTDGREFDLTDYGKW